MNLVLKCWGKSFAYMNVKQLSETVLDHFFPEERGSKFSQILKDLYQTKPCHFLKGRDLNTSV
jgi:hypothetical protein